MASSYMEEHELGRVDRMYLQAMKHKNATESPLLRLPSEIRNLIYAFALGNCDIHLKYDHRPTFNGESNPNYIGNLPATCRQLYVETRLLPFSLNEFFVDAIWNLPVERFDLLQDEQRHGIEQVRVFTNDLGERQRYKIDPRFMPSLIKFCSSLRGLRGLKRVTVVSKGGLTGEWEAFCDEVATILRDELWNVKVEFISY